MNIEELNARFESVSISDTSIKQYLFDDLSSINATRQKGYPVILMKPPNSVITPFQSDYNEPLWENYKISFYIFNRWTTDDQKLKSLEAAYRELDGIADKYLRNVLLQGGNEYQLIGDKGVDKKRGHHQHTDSLVGVNYTFTLRVYNSLCYNLEQPTNLVATPQSTTQINLAWNDNATNEDGYYVYRSADGISFTLLSTEAANTTTYNDTGLTESTVYYYKIVPFDTSGEGVASNVVAMRTDNGSICADATQVIKDSAGTILYTNSIPSGTSEDQPISDSDLTVNGAAVKSILSEDGYNLVVNLDGTPDGVWNSGTGEFDVTSATDIFLKFHWDAGDDTTDTAIIDSDSAGTYTSISDDGASGAITFSVDGGGFLNFETVILTIGQTIAFKRITTTTEGWVKLTGTY